MISIIIPTYNEIDVIQDCLHSLDKQSKHDFEVIVVDDGSDDKTAEVLRNFQFSIFSFQFLEQKHLGAGAARNFGAKNAKGEILVFVDADMTFDKDFVKNLVKPIQEGKTRGTFSKSENVSNWNNVWARCWNINEGWEEKKRHPKNYPDHQPVFRAILKSEFNRVGGFTPGGYNDDWSLSNKLGYEAQAAPGAVFFHKNPSSLPEVFKQAKWVGKREYKLGGFGYLAALLRVSFPVSIVIGLYKSIRFTTWQFMIYKLVFDWGIFVGVLEYIFIKKSSK